MEARFYEVVEVERRLAEAKIAIDYASGYQGVAYLPSERLPEGQYAEDLSRFTAQEHAAILNTACTVRKADKKAGLSDDYVYNGNAEERVIRGKRVFNQTHLRDPINAARDPKVLGSMVAVYRRGNRKSTGNLIIPWF
jgi:hypothetical protein